MGDNVVALGVNVPPVMEAVQVPNVVPPVIVPDKGIGVLIQVAASPEAEI